MSDERWRGFVCGLLLAASIEQLQKNHPIAALFIVTYSMLILFEERLAHALESWRGESK